MKLITNTFSLLESVKRIGKDLLRTTLVDLLSDTDRPIAPAKNLKSLRVSTSFDKLPSSKSKKQSHKETINQARINPYRQFTFAPLFNWLLCRKEISFGSKVVYARLAQYAGENGIARPKQEILAKEIGIEERQLRTYINELESHSLIEVERTGQGQANLYHFLYHPWIGGQEADLRRHDRQKTAGQNDRQSSAGHDANDRQKTAGPCLKDRTKRSHEEITHAAQKPRSGVRVLSGSGFTLEECERYAASLKGIHNPHAFGREAWKTGQYDERIAAFLEKEAKVKVEAKEKEAIQEATSRAQTLESARMLVEQGSIKHDWERQILKFAAKTILEQGGPVKDWERDILKMAECQNSNQEVSE